MAAVSTQHNLLLQRFLLCLLLVCLLQLPTSVTFASSISHYIDSPKVPMAKDRQGLHRQYGPSPTYEDPVGMEDYLAYVLPALAITGLSLLFPNIVTINTAKRRRRDTIGE